MGALGFIAGGLLGLIGNKLQDDAIDTISLIRGGIEPLPGKDMAEVGITEGAAHLYPGAVRVGDRLDVFGIGWIVE